MRQQTRQKYDLPVVNKPVVESTSKPEHVNFFKDLEDGAIVTTAKNKEHEQEIKEEKEKYEKQIGYLTYLGQDTNEATGKVSWYNKPRSSLVTETDGECDMKGKSKLDPICKYQHLFPKRQYPKKTSKPESVLTTSPKKHKKHKKHKSKHGKRSRRSSSESSSNSDTERLAKAQKLQILRQERLKREREEKLRADKLLAKMKGEDVVEKVEEPPPFVQKYNSQFNPHLARQNAVWIPNSIRTGQDGTRFEPGGETKENVAIFCPPKYNVTKWRAVLVIYVAVWILRLLRKLFVRHHKRRFSWAEFLVANRGLKLNKCMVLPWNLANNFSINKSLFFNFFVSFVLSEVHRICRTEWDCGQKPLAGHQLHSLRKNS